MNKINFWSFPLLAVGLTLTATSCTSDYVNSENEPDGKRVTMSFTVASGEDGSRTMLVPDEDNKNNRVVFCKNDSISVFNDKGGYRATSPNNDPFVANQDEDFPFGGDTASVATFNGEANISAQYFAILYPYQKDAKAIGDGTATITDVMIPDVQKAKAGNFDPHASVSVGLTQVHAWDVPKFYLRNVCGLLKFSVDKVYDKVVICGALGEKIAGKVTVDAATAEITDKTNATDRIVMGDLVPDKVYYVAVIPQEYKDGMSFKFYKGGTLVGLSLTQTLEIKRSGVINVNKISPDATSTKPLTGEFSVSEMNKVKFSKGNLLAIWNGSTYDWCFEERQWDFVGDRGNDSNGNMHIDGDGKNNLYAMVDLFGWTGSSAGYTDGRKQYGINASEEDSDYGSSENDACCDWGSLVSDTITWRTLTTGEWYYLLSTRKVNGGKYSYGEGIVNGVNGLIILPDNWDGSVCSGFYYGSLSFADNTFNETTTPKWSDMESAGCVFLPCAGYRSGSMVDYVGSNGNHWSSSSAWDVSEAYRIRFDTGFIIPLGSDYRCNGFSVRLACPYK